jgi:hypothetical protein
MLLCARARTISLPQPPLPGVAVGGIDVAVGGAAVAVAVGLVGSAVLVGALTGVGVRRARPPVAVEEAGALEDGAPGGSCPSGPLVVTVEAGVCAGGSC